MTTISFRRDRSIPEQGSDRIAEAYVPFYGIKISRDNQFSLINQLRTKERPEHYIKLIETMNQYKRADSVRNLAESALLIGAIAYSLIPGWVCYIGGAMVLSRVYHAARFVRHISQNCLVIEAIRQKNAVTTEDVRKLA